MKIVRKIPLFSCFVLVLLIIIGIPSLAQNMVLNDAREINEDGVDITFHTNTGDEEYDQIRWYKFIPKETNFYTFVIDNPITVWFDSDTKIYFYSSDEDAQNDKNYSYSYSENNKVSHEIKMNKGATYYIKVYVPSYYDKDTDYNMNMSISKADLPIDDSYSLVDIGTCGDKLKWIFYDNGLLSIYGEGSMTDFGYRSKPWEAYSSQITSIKIDEGVTSIGTRAFKDYSSISKPVLFPSTLMSIGNYAFYNCTGMNGQLIFNETLESIGENAFYNCTGLNGILNIPDSVTQIGEYAFYGCKGFNGSIHISNSITEINRSVFYECTGIKGRLEIPVSVSKIGEYAFYKCSGLSGDIVIPDTVTEIKSGAFEECVGFKGQLKLSKSLKEIGEYAFYGDKNLTGTLEFPDSLISLGSYSFRGCSGITGSIEIPLNITTLGDGVFRECSALDGCIKLPDKLTSIGDGAFYNCESIKGELIIPNTVTVIKDDAFEYCKGIEKLAIGSNVSSIGDCAFRGCKSLTGNISFPEKLTYIGYGAFYDCESINGTIIIPNGVTSIGSTWAIGAFGNCSEIENIILHKDISFVGTNVFYNCDKTSFYVIEDSDAEEYIKVNNPDNNIHYLSPDDNLNNIKLHTYTDWKLEKEATCIEDGKKVKYCMNCSQTIVEILPAIGHKLSTHYSEDATCEKTGNIYYISCELCNKYYLDYDCNEEVTKDSWILPAKGHKEEVKEGKPATCTESGYTDYIECSVCGKTILQSEMIPAFGHKWNEGIITEEPTEYENGIKKYTCLICGETKTETVPKLNNNQIEGVGIISADGTILIDTEGAKYYVLEKLTIDKLVKNTYIADEKSQGKYKIYKVNIKNGKITGGVLTYTKPYNKNITNVTVKDSVIINGVAFKILNIADNAFNGCEKLTKVTVGKNVTQIGKNAFYGCKNLKKVNINTKKLKKIGNKAFKGIYKKSKFKVPKKYLKKYKKMIKKAGAPKKIIITK